ncbi:Epsin-2 [Chionoecetes opilio]|uniref:Epsin-2 n=1 Tax=Chionoecetes opilio TaxID=41210 RepID=A0A8J4XXH2_CHIOP|nr:Epsin-2 [Chionoecetes opilio]
MALQMNVSGLRRNLKNIAHNYTDAQVKVREATSNDPWGPSSTLMSEVADFTYNVVAFTEIMQMIWKRLNDHGRNWRHVYKALVLLEYLIKTGSEKVADQCKENIFAIETLKDFQYFEENKDQGMNVREKAKALVTLLKDDERLRNERVRALKAKERFAQSVSGIGSDSCHSATRDQSKESTRQCPPVCVSLVGVSVHVWLTAPHHPQGRASNNPEELTIVCDGDKTYVTSTSRPSERNSFGIKDGPSGLEPQLSVYLVPPIYLVPPELEAARPQTVGEEELQLQLALAMSKEEAEQEEQKKRSDDVRLQMAITQSEEDFSGVNGAARPASTPPTSASLDPWGMPASNPNLASAAAASPLHNSHVKTFPGVDFSSPPPVPPLPSSTSTFPTNFSESTKVNFRHSNPPLLNSSPLLFVTHRHNQSTTPSPNPFHDSPSVPRPTSLLQNLNLASASRSLDDLFSNGNIMDELTDPWGMALPNGGSETPGQPDPWGSPVSGPPSRMTSPPTTADPWAPARSPEPPMGGICGNDPWAVLGAVPPAKDPWEPVEGAQPSIRDPFSPLTPTDNREMDEFTALSTREKPTNNGISDMFSLGGMSTSLADITISSKAPPQKSKSPASFLGENSNLVNLDNLVSTKQVPAGLGNLDHPSMPSYSVLTNDH